jgi:hypothetical protein
MEKVSSENPRRNGDSCLVNNNTKSDSRRYLQKNGMLGKAYFKDFSDLK